MLSIKIKNKITKTKNYLIKQLKKKQSINLFFSEAYQNQTNKNIYFPLIKIILLFFFLIFKKYLKKNCFA